LSFVAIIRVQTAVAPNQNNILLTAFVATLPAVVRALRTNPTEILRAE
jgi:hypothetical protein